MPPTERVAQLLKPSEMIEGKDVEDWLFKRRQIAPLQMDNINAWAAERLAAVAWAVETQGV
jgi:hypothetical protein